MTNNITTAVSGPTIPIRACLFCGSEARLVVGHDQVRRGIQCSGCSACVPPICDTDWDALFRWNRRSGGAAAAGSRATRGISTPRKRRSARANLALARQSKQMIAIRTKTDEAVARLRLYRDAEQGELDALSEETSARLAALLPRLEADPILKGVLGVLKCPHEEPNGQPTRRATQRLSHCC
jgi:hypothetical protein